ncbi:hypothetical protein PGTUg99_031226 [Puccinia graminis f. sp. tritici]|uniref:OTU domain-containing protein n=1 Tax=Puccinia graminis f. sp. tritici TaxID=56615 RepID=A0A5B0P405_PUCGR|nr:hypothetical protein PGTUg99_031226 [Puccinia graminis f. sp. tritici]
MTNSNQAEHQQQQQQTNGAGEEKQQENGTTTAKTIKTAADILSRPRLPPKKKLSTSNKKPGKKNKNKNEQLVTATENLEEKEEETEGHPTESIDNDQLLDQLLTQTNHLTLSSSEPTTPSTPTTTKTQQQQQQQQQQQEANGNPSRSSTISRKLHGLSEDIKEVAHAVSSSINPSSPGKLASIKPKKKPHRTKEKIAKRQAAQLQAQLDAQLESSIHPVIDHRQLEAEALLRICLSLKLQIFEIIPDGHCLFSAIADQMNVLSGQTNGRSTSTTTTPTQGDEAVGGAFRYTYQTCRKLASEYMRKHPEEFIHYLPGQDDGLEAGLMSSKEYEEHCDRVRDSACWGGEPEILALSKALKFSIHVIQAFHPTIKVSEEFLEPRGNIALTISYHRKSYGLGEHYNSLRPIS